MSKETRAAALDALAAAIKEDAPNAALAASLVLIADGLGSLERIATALENKPTYAPMGDGLIVGELAKFEPAIDPKTLKRGVAALEKLAGIVRE